LFAAENFGVTGFVNLKYQDEPIQQAIIDLADSGVD
jgi:hypothetical protein